MGKSGPTGEIFSRDDVPELVRQQHELGCHTFDHCDSWDTSPAEFESSVVRNRQAVERDFPGVSLRSLSYPISYPRPATKRMAARYFSCARGGGQAFNAGVVDLNYLQAFFLEQSGNQIEGMQRLIDASVQSKGWLIFATHDVCQSPTRFGVTPSLLEKVVKCVADSGASVLPVSLAVRAVSGAQVG